MKKKPMSLTTKIIAISLVVLALLITGFVVVKPSLTLHTIGGDDTSFDNSGSIIETGKKPVSEAPANPENPETPAETQATIISTESKEAQTATTSAEENNSGIIIQNETGIINTTKKPAEIIGVMAAPSVSSVSLATTNPATNDTNQNLIATASATDTDGDNITLVYNWYKNNVLNATSLITSGLVSYWPLNNDTLDYFGSYDGINNGATQTSGQVGNSYNFDGASNYIQLNESFLVSGENKTYSLWFNAKAYANGSDNYQTPCLLAKGGLYACLGIRGGKLAVYTYKDLVQNIFLANTPVSLNQWHHAVFILNASGKFIYLDGVADGIDTAPFLHDNDISDPSNNQVGLGARVYNPEAVNYFNGSIDEVQIYNRSLTASEVKKLYEGSRLGGNVLGNNNLNVGDTWKVGVVPYDYLETGSEAFSDNITINQVLYPNITALSPENGTITVNQSINFTANLSANNGLANATLYIYNQTGLYNQTTITLSGETQTTVGIVVSLVEGVYHWFWEAVDLFGNIANSQTTIGNYSIGITSGVNISVQIKSLRSAYTDNEWVLLTDPSKSEGGIGIESWPGDNITGGDHNGDDWIISSNTEIAGNHTNIGKFIVNPGVTVTIKAYNGSDFGWAEIHAKSINNSGTITANGGGYGGGGGGGGLPGIAGTYIDVGLVFGSGGSGSYNASAGGTAYHPSSNTGYSGAGGRGGGLFGGSGGSSAVGVENQNIYLSDCGGYNPCSGKIPPISGNTGAVGGYAASESNGDNSNDTSLNMGSGGGGGSGGVGSPLESGQASCGGGGGGSAGNPGAGYIKLYAIGAIVNTGNITAKGVANSKGNGANGGAYTGWSNGHDYDDNYVFPVDYPGPGGNGGSASSAGSSSVGIGGYNSGNNEGYASYYFYYQSSVKWKNLVSVGGNGGKGSSGAGGGVLLYSQTPNGISNKGTIDVRGGGNSASNAGTVKVFYLTNYDSGIMNAGRIYASNNVTPAGKTTAAENQSYALADANTTVYLNLSVEYYNSTISAWQFDWVVTNNYKTNLTNGTKLGLDTIWNNASITPGYNTNNRTRYPSGFGTYRVKVEVYNVPNGVLLNSSTFNFTISPNAPPIIDSVFLNSTNPLTNDINQNLTGYVTLHDPNSDNASLIYNWYRNDLLNATTLITDGLVSYYPLNNDTWDYYGANNGVNNGAVINATNGKVSAGAYFNGTGSRINITGLFSDSKSYSFAMWVKSASNGTNKYLFDCKNASTGDRFVIAFLTNTSNKTGFYEDGRAPDTFDNLANSPNDNSWHHLIFTFDNNTGNLTYYQDGVYVNASTRYNGKSLSGSCFIGSNSSASGYYFNGTLDEFMIFNRSLNASEISMLYYGSKYGGSQMGSERLSTGSRWRLGAIGADYIGLGNEIISNEILVTGPNTLPTLNSVSVTSTNPMTNDTDQDILCYANISDPEQTIVFVNYTWYNNSREVPSLRGRSAGFSTDEVALVSTVAAGNTTGTENWTCSVKAFDGQDYAANWTNATIYVIPPYPNCPNAFGNVTISSSTTWSRDYVCDYINVTNNAVITIDSAAAGNRTINITANYLTVNSGSKISADYKGYIGDNGPGAGSSYTAGGSHGGIGGPGYYSVFSSVYGSSLYPITLGSGGDGISQSGGGAIKLTINNSLINNGLISANGKESVNANGGGAGGSILVTTGTLSGTGNFTAKGGNNSGSPSYYSAGGGGRIAVYYNTTTWNSSDFLRSSANGGIQTLSSYYSGKAGTLIFVDNNSNSATIVSGFRFQGLTGIANESINTTFYNTSSPYIWNFNNLSFLNAINIVANVSNITRVALNVNNLNFNNSVCADSGTNLTLNVSYNLGMTNFSLDIANLLVPSALSMILVNSSLYANSNITVQNLSMDSGSRIYSDYKGYAAGTGPGTPTSWYAGGSHGGMGGIGYNNFLPGNILGSSLSPTTWGSGGAGTIGSGGGAIILVISNNLTNNGLVSSNGKESVSSGGGGAGGSIWVTANYLGGLGNFTAKGGNNSEAGTDYYSAGGGGRIAVYYNTTTWTTNDFLRSSAAGGIRSRNRYYDGKAGTLIFVDNNANSATMVSGFRFQGNITIANETINTTFYNTSSPYIWNFNNLTIIQASNVVSNVSNLTINADNFNFNNSAWTSSATSAANTVTMNANAIAFGNSSWASSGTNLTLNSSSNVLMNNFSLDIFSLTASSASSMILMNSSLYANTNITVQNLSLDSGSKIYSDYKGYAAQTGPGYPISSPDYYGGGSHGGAGGQNYQGVIGKIYGSSLSPTTWGSGGNDQPGGGAIIITASDRLTLNGEISSNGKLATGSGGGAGGSIWVTTNNLSGIGRFGAVGGNCTGGTYYYSAGGGGRIAVYYNTSNWTANDFLRSSANGGTQNLNNYYNGKAGTLIFVDNNANSATIVSGFSFQALTGLANETINTTFFNTSSPYVWSLNNLSIIRASNVVTNASSLTINADNLNFTNDTWTGTGTNLTLNPLSNIWMNNLSLNVANLFVTSAPNMILMNSSLYANTNITVQNLSLDSGSRIYSDYKGYSAATGPGYPAGGGAGGSHGGLGGPNTLGAYGAIYGSSLAPTTWGSGGNDQPGGGAVMLIVSNNLTVDGLVSSNGQSTTGSGAGAGGSIWVTAYSLSGTGNFSAKGGNDTNAGTYAGGGGGGRIAVYYNTTTWTANDFIRSSADGGIHPAYLSFSGKAGTLIFVDNNANSATIVSGFRFQGLTTLANETTNTTFFNTSSPYVWSLNNLSIIRASNVVTNASSLTINADNLNFTNDTWTGTGTNLTLNPLSNIWMTNFSLDIANFFVTSAPNMILVNSLLYANANITVQNLSIDSGSRIYSDYKGYAIATGPGYPGGSSAGGSHGGIGGYGSLGSGAIYGSSLSPTTWGSGGNDQPGGGAVILTVSNNLTVDGLVSSNGKSTTGSGAGAGGSIWITAYSLSGAGNFTAKGGNNTNGGNYIGAGGGGRVAVYYNTTNWNSSDFLRSSADGGIRPASLYYSGKAGTLIFSNVVDNSATIVSGFRFQGVNGTANETINTTFFNTNNLGTWNFNNLSIINANNVVSNISWAIASNIISFTNSTWNGNANITANMLTIDNNSMIYTDSAGYPSETGPGKPTTTLSAAGAGYGGIGGGSSGGPVYGSVAQPTDMGSGGGNVNSGCGVEGGGYGGGRVSLNISGDLIMNGNITSNGGDGYCCVSCSGGGSGGSIYITAGNLSGTGNISAKGGSGGDSARGRGAGGRIAIYASKSNFSGAITADRGAVGDSTGEKGSVYLSLGDSDYNSSIIYARQFYATLRNLNSTIFAYTNADINLSVTGYFNGTIIGGIGSKIILSANSSDIKINTSAPSYNITFNINNDLKFSGNVFGTTVNITSRNLELKANSTIAADSGGYPSETGPGKPTLANQGAGAGYGGIGGTTYGGLAYGSLAKPFDFGSGGGSVTSNCGPEGGGSGGGLVLFNISGNLILNGNISSNGGDGYCCVQCSGAGSGGSVYITAGGNLSGSGNVSARGGSGGDASKGRGAGGRIAIYASQSNFSGNLITDRGASGHNSGEGGTAFLCVSGLGVQCFADSNTSLVNSVNNIILQTNYSIAKNQSIVKSIPMLWNQSYIQWNDSASNSTTKAIYNLTGLEASTNYFIFDNRVINRVIASDSNGNLPIFNITLSSQHEIIVADRDIIGPNLTILAPLNGNITNATSINFTANVADNYGLANATLYIYNSTGGLYNQTTINLTGLTQATIGIVVYLVEGVYTWFWEVLDLFGNLFTTQASVGNYTLTVDTTPAQIQFTAPTPENATKNQPDVIINISMNNAADLKDFKYTWNATNYTFYNDSLVLMMNFENLSVLGENATKVVDLSKYRNNGTVMNGAAWTSSGRYGGAYTFDGVDDIINLTVNPLTSYTNFTVSAWIYKASNVTGDIVASRIDASYPSNYGGFSLMYNNGGTHGENKQAIILAALKPAIEQNSVWSTPNNSIAQNTWYHVVLVWIDGTRPQIYLNGINQTLTDWTGTTNVNNIAYNNLRMGIGCDPTNSGVGYPNFFNGSIDEVRIFNRSLSASEVQQLYYSNLQKYDTDKWSFIANYTNLTTGNYSAKACAKDFAQNENCTETRAFEVHHMPSVTINYPHNGQILQRDLNPNLNITVESSSGLLLNVTFYDSTNESFNVSLYNITGVAPGTNLNYTWKNLTAGETYKWFVRYDDPLYDPESGEMNFTPDDEPKVLNLRIDQINASGNRIIWDNEPNMEWVSLQVGNDMVEVRKITSYEENWTVSVPSNRLYSFTWQSGDQLLAMSDYHNFTFRTEGWMPELSNYSYRRLLTINHSLITGDEDNAAVNISLNDTNFKYFDADYWVYYNSFTHTNWTNGNDLRFVNYYNTKFFQYNITYWDVPGSGGVSYQTIPNETGYTGTFNDIAYSHDGDWLTQATPTPEGIYYYNYTIPASAKTSSKFRIYDGEWGWDLTLPDDCFGGSKLEFKSEANYTIPAVNSYCRNQTSKAWTLFRNNGNHSAYIYETMMTWEFATQAYITVIPEHFSDSNQSNMQGIDGDYDVKFWMYYGYGNAPANQSSISPGLIEQNVVAMDDENNYYPALPVISNLNDTNGRTTTGTNITWDVDQATDNKIRYATNPWLVESRWTSRIYNTTERFTHIYGDSDTTLKLIPYGGELLQVINVTCSNSSYSSNYTINLTKSPVEITFLKVNDTNYYDWNVTYSYNMSVDRNTYSPRFKLENLASDTQYWYEVVSYGATGNSTATGNFILGTLPSTPHGIIVNYTEDRPNKQITICANLTDMNGEGSIEAGIQYWINGSSYFNYSSNTTMTSLGSFCKTIPVEYGNVYYYRAQFIGASSTGYSNEYTNYFMPIQEFFAGSYVYDDNGLRERQYCPALADGEANLTAKCYLQTGYLEGSWRQEDWMYVETNASTDTLTLHLLKYLNNTPAGDFGMNTAAGFKYITLAGLDSNWYTFYITDSANAVILNWTKPGFIHYNNENRRDVSKYVSFNATPSAINYQLLYMDYELYNSTSYRWCIASGGDLYTCMPVEYWGGGRENGLGADRTGTEYDRGQYFRGAVIDGEMKDTGVLTETRNTTRAMSMESARQCFAYTSYWWDKSIAPSNNITSYYYRYWASDYLWSDYLGYPQSRTFDYDYLFRWDYDLLSYTRDWKSIAGTAVYDENDVLKVPSTAFNSSWNQSLIVSYVSGLDVDVSGDKIYNFGFYTDGRWTNQQLGKHQQGFVIFNLPDNATLQGLDSDGDGLNDYNELFVYYTNPKGSDTDEDNIPDGVEITQGTNPNIPDFTAPNITLVTPQNLAITNQTAINFTVNLSDEGGLRNVTFNIYNQSSIFERVTVELGGAFQTTIGVVINLVEGIYTWFVEAFDLANNFAISENRTLGVDTTAPDLAIVYPASNGISFNYNNTEVNYTVSDENLDSCWYNVNSGAHIALACGQNISITYPGGNDTVTIYANDSAGNMNSASISFSVHFALLPNASHFSIPLGTTNFTNVSDLASISDMTLTTSDARITWLDNVNANGQDFDSNVVFENGFVSVNLTNLNSTFDGSANITLYGVDCNAYLLYYSSGIYSNRRSVIENGNLCNSSTDPSCTNPVCAGGSNGNLTFTVSHFSSYAIGENSRLDIYDSNDTEGGGLVINAGQNALFYANYTNLTSAESINGTNDSCAISFKILSSWTQKYNMTFNATSLLYEYKKAFSNYGTYTWNVSCSDLSGGYSSLQATDTIVINGTAPQIPGGAGTGNTGGGGGAGGNKGNVNATLPDIVAINLTVPMLDFGNMTPGEQKANLTGIQVQNDGTLRVNIDVGGTDLWTAPHSFPGDNYLFKIGDAGEGGPEAGTFDSASLMDWTQMSTTQQLAIYNLNILEAHDLAAIQVNLTVPFGEGAGLKVSTVTLTAYSA